ncbi:MAG: hypothetical protein OXC26_06920 [Albidovulum sp.]|nr:hypothetical protein [Albidovulum sp.]
MDRKVLECAARINHALDRIDFALEKGAAALAPQRDGGMKPDDSAAALEAARNAELNRLNEETNAIREKLKLAENDLLRSKSEVDSLMAIFEQCKSEKAILAKASKLREDALSAEIEAVKEERASEIKILDSIIKDLEPLIGDETDA